MQALGRLLFPAGSRLLPVGRLLPALQHGSIPHAIPHAAPAQPPAASCGFATAHRPTESSRHPHTHPGALLFHPAASGLPFALQHAHGISTSPALSKDTSQAPAQPVEDAPASISPLQATLPVAAPALKRGAKEPVREATCHYKNVPGSWKKYNLVLDVVRRMHINDAIAQCDLVKKRTAAFVKRALINALNNGLYQKGMDLEKVVVDEIWVTKGQYRKKLMVMGRGFAGKMESKHCHLNVVLREVPERIRYRTVYVDPIMERPRKHYGRSSTS